MIREDDIEERKKEKKERKERKKNFPCLL